jgi:hypothetical protein
MAGSLKALLPDVGRLLGISSNALYERQKTLVTEGLLLSHSGRGPGSGVHADADSMAMLLIGVFAGLSLTDTGPTAQAIANAKCAVEKTCPLTGARNFHGALARVLGDEQLSNRVDCASVAFLSGTGQCRLIYDAPPLGPPETFDPNAKGKHCFFVCRIPNSSTLRIELAIDRDMRAICALLQA